MQCLALVWQLSPTYLHDGSTFGGIDLVDQKTQIVFCNLGGNRMSERVFFESDDEDNGIQVVGEKGSETLTVAAHNEWSGDTITGFGADVNVELSRTEVERLLRVMNEWLSESVDP